VKYKSAQKPLKDLAHSKKSSQQHTLDSKRINTSEEQRIFDDLDFLSNNESIDQILKKCDSDNYNERARNFKLLSKSGEALLECDRQTLEQFVSVHVAHLKDPYSKVIKEVQDSLLTFIQF